MFEGPALLDDPVKSDVQMAWGIKIPLRDGISLFATLYLPSPHVNPSPVIFTMTPYVGQTYHDVAMYFASNGYPFLTVDVRGRGNSEGTFKPYASEAEDGYDAVEWLAQQPYCNGKVGMYGGSYSGLNQWSTAQARPPHLSTIVPVASPCMAVDFPIRSNIPQPYLIQWLTLVSGRTSQDKMFWNNELFWGSKFQAWFESGAPFKELDKFVGNPSEIFQEWVAHPQQGAYWDSYNPTSKQYAEISIPILTITGAYDGDQPGALTHYREHLRNAPATVQALHYLVIGPWDHAGTRNPQAEFAGLKVGPASLVDLLSLHLKWYDWTMRGASKPDFLKRNVAYYVLGEEEWRYTDSLEAVTSSFCPLFLQSTGNPIDVFKSGTLTVDVAAASQPDHYVYDPHDVSHARLESTIDPENRVDQRMTHVAIGKQLIYHSAPFENDTEISGFFKLRTWLAIDQLDTDVRASIYEIDVNGAAILLAKDSIRARYRESLRDPQLVRTKKPLVYNFERFTFVSRKVKQGNRLRLVVGPINSIYSQKNYNSGGIVADETVKDAKIVTVKLFHDESCPSALYVPFGLTEDPACAT